MSVDYNLFLDWVENHFDDVEAKGKDIKINSIFTDDSKRHLWCCPKKDAYHCWKTGEKGSLAKLVSIVDKCSYAEARERIGGSDSLAMLEAKFQQVFGDREVEKAEKPQNRVKLPPETYRIASLSPANTYRIKAEKYLDNRMLPIGNLMICTSGKYKDRIIIPYYGPKGELIYWNGRDITDKAFLRYCGPEKEEVGFGKEDVLWFAKWPEKGTRVYLTEGEFDAMSLIQAGFVAAACGGKNVGPKQLELLRPYKIAISFDTDKSGAGALNKVGETFEYEGIGDTTIIRPPTIFKDWNEMLKKLGPKMIRAYVQQNEQCVDALTLTTLSIFSR